MNSEGGADLCSFFFLRAYRLLNECGYLGLIATNTIAQGDTRTTGLATICTDGGTIFRAECDLPWPGQAAVVVDVVHIARSKIVPPYALNGRHVLTISSYLDDQSFQGEPFNLAANENRSFIGSFVNGMGFVLAPEEADRLLTRNPKNRDVLFPYLNGEDLNSHPEQKPSRWVINFFDWPRERTARGSWFDLDEKAQQKAGRDGVVTEDYPGPVAADYLDCYNIVVERVYPVRKEVNREAHRKYWWHYGDKRPALYAAIAPLRRVLVNPIVSKYVIFAFVPSAWVYAHRLAVFPLDKGFQFAVLQSFFHEAWARTYSSTLETRINYSPSDCFESFPMPIEVTELAKNGDLYDAFRRQLMLSRQEGLTATYNRFHDPGEQAADIARLRALHVEMDHAVAAAYGWSDLDLGHGFHETAQGVRYTIHEAARRQVLSRLLELNHARYAEEVAAGLHEKKTGKKGRRDVSEGQLGLL